MAKDAYSSQCPTCFEEYDFSTKKEMDTTYKAWVGRKGYTQAELDTAVAKTQADLIAKLRELEENQFGAGAHALSNELIATLKAAAKQKE